VKFGHVVVHKGIYLHVKFHLKFTIFRHIVVWMKFLWKKTFCEKSKCHISFYRKNLHIDLSHMLKIHEFCIFLFIEILLIKKWPQNFENFNFHSINCKKIKIKCTITSNNYVCFYFIFLQFMEWKLEFSKFWGHFSINKISMNKNSKIHEFLTCDSSQDVHSFYKKKCDILTFHKKFFFHRNFIQIITGLKIVYLKWNFTWR
jgi:hypothetical protein